MPQNIGLRTILVNVQTLGTLSVNSHTLLQEFPFALENQELLIHEKEMSVWPEKMLPVMVRVAASSSM